MNTPWHHLISYILTLDLPLQKKTGAFTEDVTVEVEYSNEIIATLKRTRGRASQRAWAICAMLVTEWYLLMPSQRRITVGRQPLAKLCSSHFHYRAWSVAYVIRYKNRYSFWLCLRCCGDRWHGSKSWLLANQSNSFGKRLAKYLIRCERKSCNKNWINYAMLCETLF